MEPLTNYFMLRAQQDIHEGRPSSAPWSRRSTATSGTRPWISSTSSAYTGGIDFFHSWKNSSYYVAVNSVFSLVNGSREALLRTQESSIHYFQRPDASYLRLDPNRTSLGGYGGNFEVGKRRQRQADAIPAA